MRKVNINSKQKELMNEVLGAAFNPHTADLLVADKEVNVSEIGNSYFPELYDFCDIYDKLKAQ